MTSVPNISTSGLAALIAVGTAIATVFADWVTVRIEIPVGVLLVLFTLILIPTGDILRLWAHLITRYTSDKAGARPGEPFEADQYAQEREQQ